MDFAVNSGWFLLDGTHVAVLSYSRRLLITELQGLCAGSSQDKMLALATKEHFEKLPPVKSAVQEAVSSLTNKSMGARQAEIKRTATKNR